MASSSTKTSETADKSDSTKKGVLRKGSTEQPIPKDAQELIVTDIETAQKDKSNYQIIIDSILENMKIVISGITLVDASSYDELVNVEDATAEMPERVTSCPVELTLHSASNGEWGVTQAKLRSTKSKWGDYESVIKCFRHMIEARKSCIVSFL